MDRTALSPLFAWHTGLWLDNIRPLRGVFMLLLWLGGFIFFFCTATTTPTYAATSNQHTDSGVTLRYHADVTTTVPGGLINYTLIVTNHDMVTVTSVAAGSMLPTNTTYLSGTVTTINRVEQITQTLVPTNFNQTVLWVGTIAPQGATVLRFTVMVKEEVACRETVHNDLGFGLSGDNPLVLGELNIGVICADRPDLQLTNTSTVTSATFHETIGYQVQIRNHGLVTATDLVLLDTLLFPDAMTYLPETLSVSSGQALYDAEKHQLRWVGHVPAQGMVSITFAVRLTTYTSSRTLYSRAVLQSPNTQQEFSALAEVEYRSPVSGNLEFTLQAAATQTFPGGMIDYELTITHTGELPILDLTVVNPIPFGAAYVTSTATASSPTITTITFDRFFKQLTWRGTLAEKSSVTLHFTLQVRDRLPCGGAIINHARLDHIGFSQPNHIDKEVVTQVVCSENPRWSDFGDAPDSDSNHHGMNNTAYPETGVLGHFPTVWEGTPPHEPSGPTHFTDHFWLGKTVDVEADADLNLDPKSYDYTNILSNGQEDTADWELRNEDDGWLNEGEIVLPTCKDSLLIVRISRANLPTEITRLWLNVWFDGNRDGDWNDVGNCPTSANQQGIPSFEWIVQDWEVDVEQIPVGGYLDLIVPTKLILNTKPEMDAWMRFMVSDQRAIQPPSGGLPDGRGLAHPDIFRAGETEDYLFEVGQVERPELILEHGIEVGITETAQIGGKVQMDIYFGLLGVMAPVTLTANTTLPVEIVLLDQAKLEHVCCGVAPLVTSFNPGLDPNRTIEWQGRVLPNTTILISYEAQLIACPPPNENGEPTLRSMAYLRQPDGTVTSVEATYVVDCVQPKFFLPLINR